MRKQKDPGGTEMKHYHQPHVRQQDLKKIEVAKSIKVSESTSKLNSNNPWDANGLMNASGSSFFSEKQAAIDNMSQSQIEKLKQSTSKPFMINKRSSASNFNKKNDEDLLSEISTPEINWDERKKVMEALERRDKDRQELELEDTFKSLLGKASGVDKKDIDDVASQSASEFRETGKISIYKPTLRGNTPRTN